MLYNEIITFKKSGRPVFFARNRDGANNHFHKEIELLYIIQGKMTYTTNSGTFELESGDIAFFNSNVPHSTTVEEENTSNIVVQFLNPSQLKSPLKYLKRILEAESVSDYIFKSGEYETTQLQQYINTILTEDFYEEISYDYSILANIYLIVALLHKKKLLIDSSEYIKSELLSKVIPAMEYMNENYRECITLYELSNLLHLNEQYFSRLFKKATGVTPIDYLNFVRICQAENLLKSGENVSTVVSETGFSSLSYFNRVFKKLKNCSPTEYKKMSMNREDLS